MNPLIVETSDDTFDADVLGANLPVLLDLWAPWCGPCKALAPVLDRLAEDYAGRMTVVKFNVDTSPVIRERFGIRGIPTLLVFKGGVEVARSVGASPTGLRAVLDAVVQVDGQRGATDRVSFGADRARKDACVARLRAAIAEKRLIKLDGGDIADTFGSLPSVIAVGDTQRSYAEELGVPADLAVLHNGFFERLQDDGSDARFALEWVESMPVGADLSGVLRAFARWLIYDAKHGLVTQFVDLQELEALRGEIALLHQHAERGENAGFNDWAGIRERIRAMRATAEGPVRWALDMLAMTAKPLEQFDALSLLEIGVQSVVARMQLAMTSGWTPEQKRILDAHALLHEQRYRQLGDRPAEPEALEAFRQKARELFDTMAEQFASEHPEIARVQAERELARGQVVTDEYCAQADFLLDFLRRCGMSK